MKRTRYCVSLLSPAAATFPGLHRLRPHVALVVDHGGGNGEARPHQDHEPHGEARLLVHGWPWKLGPDQLGTMCELDGVPTDQAERCGGGVPYPSVGISEEETESLVLWWRTPIGSSGEPVPDISSSTVVKLQRSKTIPDIARS